MPLKIENIFELLKQINSTIDFDSLFNKIVSSIRDFLNVERCSLFLVNNEDRTLWSKVAQDLEIKQIILPIEKGLVGSCVSTGEIIIVDDAYSDSRFCSDIDKKTGFKTKTILCYPLKNLEGAIIGVLQLINKKRGKFNENDVSVLNVLSQHLVIALNNSIYFKQALEKKELETELSIAKTIQEKFLPHTLPEISSLKLASKNIQCTFIGGDYYDVIKLSNDKYLIIIADVSGHGIPSALLMTNIQAAFHLQDYDKLQLDEIFILINNFVSETIEMEKYITAFAGIYNDRTKDFIYVNGGHLPPLVLRGENFIELDATGIPIGMFSGTEYTQKQINLLKDDILIFYTDGIVEATNGKEMFSIERVKDFIYSNREKSLENLTNLLIKNVMEFSPVQDDDITLLIGKIV